MTARAGATGIGLALAVAGALALVGCGASTLPQVHSETERLSMAHRLMTDHEWGNAAELLKTYVQNNGGAEHVDEAIFLLGVCDLRMSEWSDAQTQFERLTRDFPESDSASAGAFMLGEAFWGNARGPDFDQEDTQKALTQWQAYLRNYPDDWRREEGERRVMMARTRLAQKLLDTADLYVKLRFNPPAQVYYKRVVDEYGDTPLLGSALIGLALCEARDGHPDAAIAALKDLEARFPDTPLATRAAQERGRVEAGRIKPARAPKPIPKAEGAPVPTP